MIALHAAFDGRELFLWTEGPAAPGKRGRASTSARPHPGDAGAAALMSAVAAAPMVDPIDVDEGCVERRVFWLPAIGGSPVPSTPVLGAVPSEGDAVLAPFLISTLSVTAIEGIEILAACAGKNVLAPGMLVGGDVAYWTQALAFAGSIVARGQLLPGLADEGGPAARFQPNIAGADRERLATLAACMPGSARAIGTPGGTAPDAAPEAVLRGFLAMCVDAMARSAHAAVPAPPPRWPHVTHWRQGASIHDRWLRALSAPEALLDGKPAEVLDLWHGVESWQRPAAIAASSPFRLGFRLEDPPEPDAPWRVRYLLQATDDPSLILPVDEARAGAKVRVDSEYLLTALGQAGRIDPLVDASLAGPDLSGHDLDTTQAWRFLNETAPALDEAGFPIWLPSWWTGKGARRRISARARIDTPLKDLPGNLSLDEVLSFQWQIALGGEPIAFEELERLAELKAPLVHLRGQWVELGAGEIDAAIALARRQRQNEVTVRDALRMALGVSPDARLPFDGVEATGWMRTLVDELDGATPFAELPPPPGFAGTLRPYQVRGYSWLAFLGRFGLGACLADDMGLGKTVQALALLQRAWESGDRRPSLLVCPTSVISNWQHEAARFTPELPLLVHHGASRPKGDTFRAEAERHALVLSSYAVLARDVELLRAVGWRTLILDEAQYVKNAGTLKNKSARAIPATTRIALTGTPVENHVGELWAIMEALNPGFLGSAESFKKTFLIPIQAHRDADAVKKLRRLTGPFILRRLKTDRAVIADLPEKLEMKVYCNLTKEQASLYQVIVGGALDRIEQQKGMGRRAAILATITKLKQVCNHPAQLLADNSALPGRSGKLARLTDMLAEVRESCDRALVFSQYAEMGTMLKRHLEESFGVEVPYLHGGVERHKREGLVARFQDESGPPFFVLSLKAGGTGLNLTRASHVFHYDRWWNPAVETQATDRAYRIGQTQPVQVHKLICAGTVEEKIDGMIESKRHVAEQVIGSGDGFLTELSTRELRDLFALDAVGADEA